MAGRSRRGVSPIIATLLLIVIALAGAVITYAFVSGLIGGSAPQALSLAISVDSVTSNDSHVLIYVRNAGTAQASIDRVYVEQGGSLVAAEDVSVAIPPGTVGSVAIGRGALSSGTPYVFKIFCGGNTMPTAYSSSIGGGAGPAPTDTTPPSCSGATANDTEAGMPCLFSSAWGDDVALSGFIFSTNATGSWANSSWSAFSGSIGSAVAALPSAGTVVGYRFYANDTSDNWGGSGVQYLTTGHYVWVTDSSTVVTGYTSPSAAPSGSWLDPPYAYADGINYASSSTSASAQLFSGYGFSLPANTTSIDGIIIRYDTWYSGSLPTYTEMFAEISEGEAGWRDYDIYTTNGVPKGAIVEIIVGNQNNAACLEMGVRTDGSSLSRCIRLHEAEAGGNVTASFYVKVHESTGLIETYCNSTTGARFFLVGYWTGVDFTELMEDFTMGSTGWRDYNLTTENVPAGSVAQIYMGNKENGVAKTMGVRTPGSALNRHISIHEAESATTEYTDSNGFTTFVKSNSTGYIQAYVNATAYHTFYVLGYFGSSVDYQELWQNTPQGTGWVNLDLTAYLDQDGRVVNMLLGHSATGAEHTLGVRTGGSAINRAILCHEAETNMYTGISITVKTNSTGHIQGYTSTTSEYFYLAGYFKPVTKIRVDASYNGGTNWVTCQETELTGSEAPYTFDVGDLRAWSYSELSDASFRVRVVAVTSAETSVCLDWVPVSVTYTYDTSHWECTTTP